MNRKLRIVFMGTPDFAVPSLRAIHEGGYDIAAVVTAPDKPAGRGLQLHQSPVKEYALAHQIPVLQPLKLKDPEFLEKLRSYHANLQVVVAFRMLPDVVWQMPLLGTFNLHASLLPDYRGAAPINWAVINGETQTGATTFFLKHEIDTGDIIFQEKITIEPEEDAGAVHDRLIIAGAALVLKTLRAIDTGSITTVPQTYIKEPKPAPKLFKEDCKIDWQNQTLGEIHNFIRGLSPHPTAWTMLDGKVLKIYKTEKEREPDSVIVGVTLNDNPIEPPDQSVIAGVTRNLIEPAGIIITDQKTFLKIACMGGYLCLLELQLEGRKKMGVEEFLRGYAVKNNAMM